MIEIRMANIEQILEIARKSVDARYANDLRFDDYVVKCVEAYEAKILNSGIEIKATFKGSFEYYVPAKKEDIYEMCNTFGSSDNVLQSAYDYADYDVPGELQEADREAAKAIFIDYGLSSQADWSLPVIVGVNLFIAQDIANEPNLAMIFDLSDSYDRTNDLAMTLMDEVEEFIASVDDATIHFLTQDIEVRYRDDEDYEDYEDDDY